MAKSLTEMFNELRTVPLNSMQIKQSLDRLLQDPFSEKSGALIEKLKSTIRADLGSEAEATKKMLQRVFDLEFYVPEDAWTFGMGRATAKVKVGDKEISRENLKTSDTDSALFAVILARQMIKAAERQLLAVGYRSQPKAADADLFRKWFGGDDGTRTVAMRAKSLLGQYQSLKRKANLTPVVLAITAERWTDPEDTSIASARHGEANNVIYLWPGFYRPEKEHASTATEFLEVYRDGMMFLQAQTIVHEWSHKYCNPKSVDVRWANVANNPKPFTGKCYGRTKCLSMAEHNPAEAATNADNIGYFAIEAWLKRHRAGEYRQLVEYDESTEINWAAV